MDTRTRLYEGGRVVAEGFAADEGIDRLAKHPDAVLWLDLLAPGEDDLRVVADAFGLHPLAVEDAVQVHERPKLDHFPGHLFLNVYAVELRQDEQGRPHPRKAEISAFVTERALITVRKSEADVDELIARWDVESQLSADGGVGFLIYGLLDLVVDGHTAAVDRIDRAMDGIEDAMLEEGGAPRPARMRAFALRKTLAELRRAVSPMPDVITQVIRTDHLVTERLAPYFRDVDDHARHATDSIEHGMNRINNMLEVDLSEKSNVLNDVTRKLAAWAAIIAVPTALTGYFGQNLPYPGYEKFWGFVFSMLLIVVTGGGLYWYLRRRGWL